MEQKPTQDLQNLMKLLGCSGSAGGANLLDQIDMLKHLLKNDPGKALATAPAMLGTAPSVERASGLLDEAESALRNPAATLAVLKVNNGTGNSYDLPEQYQFPGYNPEKIPINHDKYKFETYADAPAWFITAIMAWFFRWTHDKPDMPKHTSSETAFCYRLRDLKGTATLALFSDWGTGYYHSQYIAKHIGTNLKVGQAIHLGDVYYTGRQSEFNDYFKKILEKYVLKKMPFYALNANHEMDSHGISYFKFLQDKYEKGQNGKIHKQPQEGSYFCLSNKHYQVIGIDTAYFENGRHRQSNLQDWLCNQLTRGRNEHKVNILLSQNEPYSNKKSKLLRKDLANVAVHEKMVDLWFWGDEHYCALYGPSKKAPFVGSCIGHGGYPYSRKSCSDMKSKVAPLLWGETAPRFPEKLGVRIGRGNNGFCYLILAKDKVELTYYDWRFDKRHSKSYRVCNGRLVD